MLQLKNILESDYNNIKEITKLKSVMRYIGNGAIWDENKIQNFIKYNLIESKLTDNQRENYYYKICSLKSGKSKSKSKSNFIGIIGFHKFPQVRDKHNFYLTIFIHPKHQNKGYFSQSIQLLIKKIKNHKPKLKKIFSLTHSSNKSMTDISHHKFTYDKEVKFQGNMLHRFIIYIDLKSKKYKKHFYLVKSNYLKNNMVFEVFNSINKKIGYEYWTQFNIKHPQIQNPTLLYLDGNYIQNKHFRQYKPQIKNLVDDEKYSIADKEKLYTNLFNLNQNKTSFYLKPQLNIDLTSFTIKKYELLLKLFQTEKIWIMKPVDGFAGKGIKVIENRVQCTQYLKEIKTNANLKKYKKWVIQEYITKPLLFKKRKFHIRAYFLYIPNSNKSKSNISSNNSGYLLDIAKIFIAGKDYIVGDYQNQSIHDTHLKSTPQPLYFERDFKKEFGKASTTKVKKQMITIFKDVLKCLNAKCYSESKKCYELFGADLMIDENMIVKLIEVNTKIGLGSYPNDKLDINKIIFENVMDVVLDRHDYDNFIKL